MADLNIGVVRHVKYVQGRGQGIGFEIEGINKLRRALVKLDDQARDDFKQAGFDAANIVVKEAQRLVPKRSGKLQKSIRAGKVVSGAKVSAGRKTVPYAGAIHFGWARRNIRPNPFLYDAADNRVNEVMDTYIEQVYKIWNRNV
jgi:hypothetical protein